MSTKRRTWHDRKRGSVGVTLDCITPSGMRWTTTNDPFNDNGNSPAHAAQMTVRTLAIIYGIDRIEAACNRGLLEARKSAKKRASRLNPGTVAREARDAT